MMLKTPCSCLLKNDPVDAVLADGWHLPAEKLVEIGVEHVAIAIAAGQRGRKFGFGSEGAGERGRPEAVGGDQAEYLGLGIAHHLQRIVVLQQEAPSAAIRFWVVATGA